MAFRLKILSSWFLGWVTAAVIGLLGLIILAATSHNSAVAHPASIIPLLASTFIPACFCRYSGLQSWRSLASIVLLSILGWWFGSMFTPSVSMSYSMWMSRIADLPLVGHEWTLPCMFFSGIAALCGIILDPNTKCCFLNHRNSDPTA